VELSEDGFSITFGLDGTQFSGNDVEGFDDLGGSVFSGNEVFMILGSGVSQDLFLFVKDVELSDLVFNLRFEEVELLSQSLDFVA